MKNILYFEEEDKGREEKAFVAIEKEKNILGYYSLPEQDISEIISYINTIDENIESIAVIGIGGSSLGAKAVYEFIKPVKKLQRKLYFFESTDPINIASLLNTIDIDKTHFLVISKSGHTVETFSVYKYLYSLNSKPKHYTFVTDKGSPLAKYAQSIEASLFYLPANVGGRFSVLSIVGLLPLALCGIDIETLLKGAKELKDAFFQKEDIEEVLVKKAVYYAKNHHKNNINCIFAYSESLEYFCQWYVQLWGESLGKQQKHSALNVGLTPIGLIGPKDQHSFLQLIMEGTRDKSITFIQIQDFQNEMSIPDISLRNLESLDNLNNLSFSSLINMQCESVIEALRKEDIPIDKICLPKVDEKNIGKLIYYYELLTSLVGNLIDVDTYNQPGVEVAKLILKEKLNARN